MDFERLKLRMADIRGGADGSIEIVRIEIHPAVQDAHDVYDSRRLVDSIKDEIRVNTKRAQVRPQVRSVATGSRKVCHDVSECLEIAEETLRPSGVTIGVPLGNVDEVILGDGADEDVIRAFSAQGWSSFASPPAAGHAQQSRLIGNRSMVAFCPRRCRHRRHPEQR